MYLQFRILVLLEDGKCSVPSARTNLQNQSGRRIRLRDLRKNRKFLLQPFAVLEEATRIFLVKFVPPALWVVIKPFCSFAR